MYLVRRGAPSPPGRRLPARRSGEDERRILVVANETVGGGTLREEIRRRSEGYDEHVLVVCPALNSAVRHWASDEDGARAQAQERLDASLARLREAGVDAKGEIGDAEPLQAIEDALRIFGAGRDHHLDSSRGPLALARARRSSSARASVSRSRSRTSSSTSRQSATEPGLALLPRPAGASSAWLGMLRPQSRQARRATSAF